MGSPEVGGISSSFCICDWTSDLNRSVLLPLCRRWLLPPKKGPRIMDTGPQT